MWRLDRAPVEPGPRLVLRVCGGSTTDRGDAHGAHDQEVKAHPLRKKKKDGNLPVLSWIQRPTAQTDQAPICPLRRIIWSCTQVAGIMNSGVRKNPSRVFSQINAT
jgi:hypothetical protein